MSRKESLWIVIPVYNEVNCIASVISELRTALTAIDAHTTLCIVDDGSTDGTSRLLEDLSRNDTRIKVLTKHNSGHGQSCIYGYRAALEAGADWILQFDSDGQCDPGYIGEFWRQRHQHTVIYGFRTRRDDGLHRLFMSRLLTLLTFFASGVFVRDVNVPYRLMHRDALMSLVPTIPSTFYMANMCVAVEQASVRKIHWIDIRFRSRFSGTSKQGNVLKLLSRCLEFLMQIRSYRLSRERSVSYTRVVPEVKTGGP